MSAKASRLEVVSWCLYDFADSSFTTLIVTVAYSLYFRSVVAGHLGPSADFYWGLCIAVSMLLVALTSPVLGAMADASGRKKTLLALYAGTSIGFTALLGSVGAGDLASGMLLFIVANVGYEGAHVFYNGFLPEIASDEEMGRISGYGWGIGYLGGLAALLLTFPFTGAGLEAGGAERYRITFPVVAGFFLVFALPVLLILRERARSEPAPAGARVREGLRRLRQTFAQVRTMPDLFRFLVAFIVYNDAVTTVISFSAIYAMHVIGYTARQVTMLFIVTQLTAFAGAFAAGHLVDRWGAKRTIVAALLLWCGTILGAYLADSVPGFFAVAVAASIGMGSLQAASRSLMGLLIPPGRNAEFFGFYALTGKVSAVAGPLLYGWIAARAGGERPAVLSLLVILGAGLALMLPVDVERGRRTAAHSRA
ncbi:MAG: MFS transporter [Acidobacteria bacterium]|nr:MFS transporter [Acidobacteriota bacterium]